MASTEVLIQSPLPRMHQSIKAISEAMEANQCGSIPIIYYLGPTEAKFHKTHNVPALASTTFKT